MTRLTIVRSDGEADGTPPAPRLIQEAESFAEKYRAQAQGIVDMFSYELCDECGQDIDRHVIAPGPFGLPHAWCLDGDAVEAVLGDDENASALLAQARAALGRGQNLIERARDAGELSREAYDRVDTLLGVIDGTLENAETREDSEKEEEGS